MLSKSKKVLQWKAKDYGRTISLFFVHTLIIMAMFVLAVFANLHFSLEEMGNYLKSEGAVNRFVYVGVATLLISCVTYLYFYSENRDFILKSKNINLIFTILEISIAAMYIVGRLESVYARPFALCALLALLLINRNSAIFLNTTVMLLMFMLDAFMSPTVSDGNIVYSALIIGYITSIIAIYLVYGIRSRLKVFLMGFVLAIPIVLGCLCLEFDSFLVQPATFLLYGFTSGMLSVVLMMSLLPFYERIFNMLTNYRLAEITDHKSKLIQMLITQAPGTFNHSLIVSTMVESCASAIGEDAILARACAYYHDMGKLKNPEFFTENQQGYNPHNELSPELSTDIIRSHAKDGYDLIKKYHLPQILADSAIQHHGTMQIRFFYAKALKYTEGELDIANYSYLGPKPQTKIAAIIMIADGCEAKVRTLSERTHEKVDAAVREIIEERMDYDQFSECDLTMKDIDIIRKTITNNLAGVYHDRVEYPKLRVKKG